ncbi:hypothetical protein Moror_11307 [Moniliophthora roreri MCA 2997]|uniref:Uncharacterized protein n=1 Tax=Moniliophthora roreri (strain MCA 2997) TaxID=1381753 RepID=V2WPP3_MONRO|nr:hypothetical protein Moror_11307 [Moniliophthora roreri MCA 2997]
MVIIKLVTSCSSHAVIPQPGGSNQIEGITVAGQRTSANFKVPDELQEKYEESFVAPLHAFKKLTPIALTSSGSQSLIDESLIDETASINDITQTEESQATPATATNTVMVTEPTRTDLVISITQDQDSGTVTSHPAVETATIGFKPASNTIEDQDNQGSDMKNTAENVNMDSHEYEAGEPGAEACYHINDYTMQDEEPEVEACSHANDCKYYASQSRGRLSHEQP